MRLLADENFPVPVVRELRQRGHDVSSVKEKIRGSSDPGKSEFDSVANGIIDLRIS